METSSGEICCKKNSTLAASSSQSPTVLPRSILLRPLALDPFHGRATREIYGVDASLVQVYEENDVVAEARQPVHGGHADHEREQVVDERVARAVHEHAPRQVRDGAQLVAAEAKRSGGGRLPLPALFFALFAFFLLELLPSGSSRSALAPPPPPLLDLDRLPAARLFPPAKATPSETRPPNASHFE